MKRKLLCLGITLFISSLAKGQPLPATTAPTTAPNPLLKKIQDELSDTFNSEEGKPNPNVPHGEWLHGTLGSSPIYPGTDRQFEVYVPAQYDPAKPACFLLRLDTIGTYEGNVLDNLIAKKEVPVMIGIGLGSGGVWTIPPAGQKRHPLRMDRTYEFDSMNDNLADYVLNELLPAVEKLMTHDGRPIHLSRDGNDHMVSGGSTGGIGSFTLAWRRPDQFTRVYDVIGTFVSMRGGHEYPAIIRKTEPKPIRIFLEDGSKDAWNPLFGSWFDANVNMESALTFAGYDVGHAWGTHGHNGRDGAAIFPDVLRWLWRDYPARIPVGTSQNSTLRDILPNNSGWQTLPAEFQDASGLAADPNGEVYLSDVSASVIYHLGSDDRPVIFQPVPNITSEVFGPDDTLYGVAPVEKKIVAINPKGGERTIADGIAGRGITITHDGTLYVSEPGEHTDMPSRIWQIKADGEKKIVDEGLLSASGIAFSPDGALFVAAENSTKWIYSYVAQPDGTFIDKQRYYWLHMTDIINDSGALDVAFDAHGELYVATRMGVQICDQNGRVRAILPLPAPAEQVRSLCFGGPKFDILYATDGKHLFKRTLKSHGHLPSAMPTTYPSEGGG
jgi:gluconolactonase